MKLIKFYSKGMVVACAFLFTSLLNSTPVTFHVYNYLNSAVTLYFTKQATANAKESITIGASDGLGGFAGSEAEHWQRVEMHSFPMNTINHLKIVTDAGTVFDENVNMPWPGKEIYISFKRPWMAEFAIRLRRCGGLLESHPDVKKLLDDAVSALREITVEIR